MFSKIFDAYVSLLQELRQECVALLSEVLEARYGTFIE